MLSLAICGSSKRIRREQWRIEATSIEGPLTVFTIRIQGQILVRVELLGFESSPEVNLPSHLSYSGLAKLLATGMHSML